MRLRSLAEEYCALIQEAPQLEVSQFIPEVARVLSTLVAVMYELDEPVNITDTGRRDGVTHDEWNDTFRTLQRVLGDEEREAAVPEAEFVEDYLAISLELPDALADIWRDLRDGLDGLADGDPEDEVLWDWWFGFYSHWGKHATEALSALHQRIVDADLWHA